MNQSNLNLILKEHYPFDLLTEDEFRSLIDGSSYKTYMKNEFIFHEEDEIDQLDIYFLVSGLAKNILHQSNGKQVAMRYYYPGDIVGLMVMLSSGEMNFSVQALEDCSVFKLKKETFFEIMTNNKSFSKVIWESIGDRLKSLYNEIKSKPTDDEKHIGLFNTRVKSIMDSVTFIKPFETMQAAIETILNDQVDGLIVSYDNQSYEGVITKESILEYSLQKRTTSSVKEWYEKDILTVDDQSFAYEALSYFKHNKTNFLPVVHNQKIVGALTPKSFLNLEDVNGLDLSLNILKSRNYKTLYEQGPLSNKLLQTITTRLVDNENYAYEVTEFITSHNDQIYKQLIKLTEDEMKSEGYGNPPVNYCFIVMGSQARKEQVFSTDQDNGMILGDYHHLSNKDNIEIYFQTFTEKLATHLIKAGFQECTGGIMAKEKKWRKSISEWKENILYWLKEMDAEEIQRFTMFYDFRPLFGDFSLANEIRSFLTERSSRSKGLQHFLLKDALRYKIPIQPFGLMKLNTKNKQLNMKKSGLMQMVNTIRIHSIKYGIKDVSTIKRLNALKKAHAMHPRDVENAKLAIHYFQLYRLQQNLDQLSSRQDVSNEVSISTLSKEEKFRLKEAIQIANRMQQVTRISFNRNRVV
ncbi:DUF294 nucleotidyltransferase-like domain-containing protein [Bacillus salitolerans]|uniref:DUF294 nucleotidyltransferase-like domain-containing protein n=1 Tax=Bacillus salitolerans TaxID=1437434 RepID=A0ABW4LQC8_9BACI